MRKYMVGYGIWNKQDMIGWLLDGISENVPEVAHVAFVFDHCWDKSRENFNRMYNQFLLGVPMSDLGNSERSLHEVGVHLTLMRHFMSKTNCDVLIMPQDDERISRPVLPLLEKVLNKYGDRIGIIGGRSGYDIASSTNISARWVKATGNEKKNYLSPGGFTERPYVNTGPIVYPRSTIEKAHYLDAGYEHWFIWEDYAASCKYTHGLTNVVVDFPIRHLRFGGAPATTYYNDGSLSRDRKRMVQKWGHKGWH